MNDRTYCTSVAGSVADYLWQEVKIHPARGDYRVARATSGPRVLTLSLVLNPRHAPRIMSLAEQLSMAAGLDRDASIRVTRGARGTLVIEIPKPHELQYNVPARSLPRRHGLKAPIGVDGEHRPAVVDFANPLTPHLLTAGTTGSGKTNTSRLIIHDLASQNSPDEVRFILVDTRKRGTAWRPFWRLPHLAYPVIIDEPTALRALTWAAAEIDRRSERGQVLPHTFIAVDEAQALLGRDEFVGVISDIAAVGREFGIHLMLATQNPTKEQLGSTAIKHNLTVRLLGKFDSAGAAADAAGIKESGAEKLTGPGDQLLIQPDGIRRVTAALITDEDTAALPQVEPDHQYPLNFDEYDDVDHVLDVADNGGKAAPVQPEHVAVALAAGRGITWLAKELGIGASRATRVKDFADRVADKLQQLGYTTIPLSQYRSLACVTGLDDGEVE